MSTTFGWIALVGFVLSLAAHVTAILGIDVQSSFPAVWALHLGIFVVFIPMILQFGKMAPKDGPWGYLRTLPPWTLALLGVLLVYVLINFFIFASQSAGGSAVQQGSQYVLQNKGVFVRELTETEYHAYQANEVRGFSGHWLLFYLVPFAHFILRPKSSAD